MSYSHPPVAHSISSPPSPHHQHHHNIQQHPVAHSSSIHPPPTSPTNNPQQSGTTTSARRSSICSVPFTDLVQSYIPAASQQQQSQQGFSHRRSRSFRDGARSPRPLHSRYTTFEFDNAQISEHEQERKSSVVVSTTSSSVGSSPSSCSLPPQKRLRNRPPPLQCSFNNTTTQSNSSSVCSSASTTQTSVFFNTSTESTNSTRGGSYSNRVTQPCSPNSFHTSNSNWSMCSEYSTTSSVQKTQNASSFPKGKLAYLASRRGSSGSVCSSTTNTPPNTPGYSRFGNLAARRQSSGNFLEVPPATSLTAQDSTSETPVTSPATTPTAHTSPRSRVNSLPATSLFSHVSHLSPTYAYPPIPSPTYTATPNPRNEDYLYRLRTFNITKGGDVVNCGDTFVRKSKSNNCITSEHTDSTSPRKCSLSTSPTRSQRSSPCHHRRGSLSPRLVVNYPLLDASCCVSRDESDDDDIDGCGGDEEDDLLENEEIPVQIGSDRREVVVNKRYRVVLLGESGVGKSALVRQFMTSEYINTYDMSLDEEYGEREVSILLDSKESSLVFVDHPFSEIGVENSLATYEPHAAIVVYSVTDRHSFEFASEILRYLWQERTTHKRSVILVGNKCDLARARVISTQEGKNLATSHDTKFIETSSGIQHNVDNLLVGVLKQIRLREAASCSFPPACGGGTGSSCGNGTGAPSSQQQPATARKKSAKGRRSSARMRGAQTPRGTIMSLLFTRELINKLCFLSNKAKSCENLHVL